MVHAVFPDLYRIEIPLPDSPLKSLNAYVVLGSDRNLLIDTGFNRKECLAAMKGGLSELKISLDDTDLLITHLHADHIGLVPELVRNGSKVFFSRPDAEIIQNWEGFGYLTAYAVQNGFSDSMLQIALETHPAAKFFQARLPDFTLIENNQRITVGAYCFRCLITPGHTRGHTCLYEPQKRLFISGDHVLGDITPHIQCWREEWNPLGDYLESLDRVCDLDVDVVLPGHRRVFYHFRQRIDEIKQHHQKRMQEIESILRRGPMNAYQVASHMTWDINYKSWDDFPILQKWFATGEAIAHLKYLYATQKIARDKTKNGFLYTHR
jgi:glyoxylase-like metal-dependent hydrolase (beta-lactamase superfamily II)